jgi:hypothetical protein
MAAPGAARNALTIAGRGTYSSLIFALAYWTAFTMFW